jgi:hypothetical protein
MNRELFYNYVLPKLNPLFEGSKYELRKSKYGWLYSTDEFKMGFWIGFWETGNECSTTLSFSVRLNKVEKILNNYRAINPKETSNTITFILYLTDIINYNDGAFRFYNNEQLNHILNTYYIPFIKDQLPTLTNCYSSIDNIMELFCNETHIHYKHLKNPYVTYTVPIIISKIYTGYNYSKIVESSRIKFIQLKEKWFGSTEIWLYEKYFDKMLNDLSLI